MWFLRLPYNTIKYVQLQVKSFDFSFLILIFVLIINIFFIVGEVTTKSILAMVIQFQFDTIFETALYEKTTSCTLGKNECCTLYDSLK